MVDFNELQQDIIEWQETQFPNATGLSKSHHLLKEAQELVDTPDDESEMADILILLIGIAHKANVNLLQAAKRKLIVNKSRKWGKPDANGVVEHV